jgi:hypothetical protein
METAEHPKSGGAGDGRDGGGAGDGRDDGEFGPSQSITASSQVFTQSPAALQVRPGSQSLSSGVQFHSSPPSPSPLAWHSRHPGQASSSREHEPEVPVRVHIPQLPHSASSASQFHVLPPEDEQVAQPPQQAVLVPSHTPSTQVAQLPVQPFTQVLFTHFSHPVHPAQVAGGQAHS